MRNPGAFGRDALVGGSRRVCCAGFDSQRLVTTVRFRPLPFWYSGSNQPLAMARYRIVRRPSCLHIGEYVYDVERRVWPFGWKFIDGYLSLEKAEALADRCKRRESLPQGKKDVVWESTP